MGIPGLNKFLWKLQQIERLQIDYSNNNDRELMKTCHHLFIDMDQIIHESVAPLGPYMESSNTFEDINARILHKIDSMIDLTKPKKTIFIAYDGIQPIAKLQTIRKNWFLNAHTINKEYDSYLNQLRYHSAPMSSLEALNKSYFDRNCIVPGTNFITNQSEVFEKAIKILEEKYRKLIGPQLKIYISKPDIPNEGENKIMDHIRHKIIDHSIHQDEEIFIISADGDFVMLCLIANHHYQMRIIKKFNVSNDRVYNIEIVNVNDLRISLLHRLKGHKKITKNDDAIIESWVFACNLAGNDFLPNIDDFGDFYEALLSITKAMADYIQSHEIFRPLIDSKSDLIYQSLYKFLMLLRRYIRPSRRYLDPYSLAFSKKHEQFTYHLLESTNDYLFMINIIHRYYKLKCNDMPYQYTYFYGPPISALLYFLQNFEVKTPFCSNYEDFQKHQDYELNYEQIFKILIMPLQSLSLLDESIGNRIKKVIKEKSSYIKQFYECFYEFDLAPHHRYMTQAVVFMPHIKNPKKFISIIASIKD